MNKLILYHKKYFYSFYKACKKFIETYFKYTMIVASVLNIKKRT